MNNVGMHALTLFHFKEKIKTFSEAIAEALVKGI